MNDLSRLHFAHFDVNARDDGTPWELGRGAMGVTYKAYDPQLRLDVALKVINPAQVGDEKARALFLREARAAARVHHANVGSVVYLNQDPQNMFYAMEFIAGESLRDWMHSRVPLPPHLAIGLSLQIARGLEAIHREHVIHRDLKPTNLMIVRADKQKPESDPGAWLIKIIDFGLARNAAVDVSETSAAANTTGFRGTALYASPEQCEERRDLDGRSDLYSLGCVMWEMLVGTTPFRANVHRELLNAHVAKPPPLAQLSHLPASLRAVVARLLMKDREARFADAGEVIRALKHCREQIGQGSDGEEIGLPTGNPQPNDPLAATSELPELRPTTGGGASGTTEPKGRRTLLWVTSALLLLAVSSLIGWKSGWFSATTREGGSGKSQWDAPMIAVLPVDSVDRGKDETRFADGLGSDLIERIAKLPRTRVVPRSAVSAYRLIPGGPARKRVPVIDAELGGVSAVLETSVDRNGDDLEIQSVLYDAKTEERLWGKTYKRNWNDASLAEKEVPEQIAMALRTRLAAARRENPAQRQAGSPTAADLYFQAVTMDPFDKNRKAQMERVIAMDPDFAEAYGGIALFDANMIVSPYVDAPRGEEAKQFARSSEQAVKKALSLDPDCVPALVAKWIILERAGKSGEANQALDRALQLAPNDQRANLFAGFRETDPVQGYAYIRRAHSIDPDLRRLIYALFEAAKGQHLNELADQWVEKLNRLTRDLQLRELGGCQQLILRGKYQAALDRLRLLPPDLVRDHYSVPEMLLETLIGLGKYDEALKAFETQHSDAESQAMRDLPRAELLWRAERMEDARAAATRFAAFQQGIIDRSKADGTPIWMGYFRLAKALEILGRQQEAVAQLQNWAQGKFIPEPRQDPWVFRNNPAALEILAKVRERADLIGKRILEIERSYSEPSAAGALK
jgi:serine/threonine protein kinase